MNHAEQLSLGLPSAAPASDWNPRYIAYCAEQGREPSAQLEYDREAFPGGCMADFIIWIGARWRQWRAACGIPRDAPLSNQDHEAFDRWLTGRGWTLL